MTTKLPSEPWGTPGWCCLPALNMCILCTENFRIGVRVDQIPAGPPPMTTRAAEELAWALERRLAEIENRARESAANR